MTYPMTIPFHQPLLDEADIQAVVETLRSGWITTGPRAKALEQALADYVGARYAIAVNSCTAAMHLALAALGVGAGDVVITTPYTFVGTTEAIQYLGARPLFVDIKESDFNIDPDKIAAALERADFVTDGQVRAIMPVHLAGHPCDMHKIMALAEQYGLVVVEDAAHALEAAIVDRKRFVEGNGKRRPEVGDRRPDSGNSKLNPQSKVNHRLEYLKVGTIGDATCFSFYATKNITSGEGGMVATNDEDLADKMRILSLHGMSRDAWKRYTSEGSWYYEIVEQGYKYNMPDILAALGLSQLRKAEAMFSTRRKYAEYLQEQLAHVGEIIVPTEAPGVKHAWHLFVIRLRLSQLNINRSHFIEELKIRGVHCSVHFIPLHLQPYFQNRFGYRRGDFPVAERVYESVVSLPFYPAMTEEQLRYVADMVKDVIRLHSKTRSVAVPTAAG